MIVALLSICLLSASPNPQPLKVVSVELRLPSDADPLIVKEAPTLVAVRRGQNFSRKAIRRSIELLWVSQRFSEIAVRCYSREQGVVVEFELTPARRISFITVRGGTAVTEKEALLLSGLKVGADIYPERLARAVELLEKELRRRGWENATVFPEVADFGRGLELTLQIAQGVPTTIQSLTVSGEPGIPLDELRQTLGIGIGDILDRNVLEQGLARLRARYRELGYLRTSVSDPMVESAASIASVIIPLRSGPRFDIHFRGNRRVSDGVLRSLVMEGDIEYLDDSVKSRMARVVEAHYRSLGFYDVQVTVQEVSNSSGSRAILRFDVVEGNPLFVREVIFSGNRSVSSIELRSLLTEAIAADAPARGRDSNAPTDPLSLEGRVQSHSTPEGPDPERSTVFVESSYQNAVAAMTGLYRARGFLSAQVTLKTVSIEQARRFATVRIAIDEGPMARVSQIIWQGLPDGFQALEGSRLEIGKPFIQSIAEDVRRETLRDLGRQGYLYSQIEWEYEVTEEGRLALIRYQVLPGPQVRVGKIIFQGLNRTQRWLVQNQLKLREGDILDTELLYDSQRQLILLGIFKTVAVKLVSPDEVAPTKDVVVEVKELPRLSSDFGTGYFFAEGPRLILDWNYPNLFGAGVNISGRGKVHFFGASGPVLTDQADVSELSTLEQIGGQQTVSIQSRGLLPANLGARIDIPIERVILRFYRYTRFAAVPGVNWEHSISVPRIEWARLRLGATVQYEIESVSLDSLGALGQLLPTLASTDQSRLRFPEGFFALQTLRMAQTLDLRDNPTNPSRGVLLALSQERTWDIFSQESDGTLGAPIQTLRVAGNLSGYIPLGQKWVLALSGRGGRIFPLNPNSRTIAPKRFFLGGAASMRGFREDGVIPADRREALREEVSACQRLANPAGCTEAAQVLIAGREVPSEGGELFVLGKGELRFPVSKAFDVGIFLEAGNLWLSPLQFNPFELRYVAGTGLRFVTPIGPLALDVGANLRPDSWVNEPLFNLHFNIGLF